MLPTQNLGYEAQKSIFQLMEFNKRLEISRFVPAVRAVEHATNAWIKKLAFGEMKTVINDTTYQLGIIREFDTAQVLGLVQIENDNGGWPNDIDDEGNLLRVDNHPAAPGDLDLRFIRQPSNRGSYSLNPDLLVDQLRIDTLIYQRKCNNQPPPYKIYVQLTIDSPNGKRTERYGYTMKLHEAMKKLNDQLLGNRGIIQVDHLEIMSGGANLCLPVGLKLQIKELKTDIRTLDAVKPIISETSYPLIRLIVNTSEDNYPILTQHETASTAKTLVIGNFYLPDILPILGNLRNDHVIVNNRIRIWEFNHAILVTDWLHNRRPTGHSMKLGFMNKESAEKIIHAVRNRFSGRILNETCAILSQDDRDALKIMIEEAEPGTIEAANLKYSLPSYWYVKIESC